MTSQTLAALEAGEYKDAKRVKIPTGITTFPTSLLTLLSTLEILDLSSNASLSSLPSEISCLHKLKVAFFSDCNFTTFPKELAQCRSLEMIAFKNNHMTTIPENSFPRKLRWLILTNNEIEDLPKSIGHCGRLQKCMLAGNRLTSLPDEMSQCRKLGLLRLSCNRLEKLPDWLFEMPELSFLSFSGNPCADSVAKEEMAVLVDIAWDELEVQQLLGEGASGIISKGVLKKDGGEGKDVAIKLFKGEVTSDGSPADEMNACISAGRHGNLIDPIGKIHGHPETKGLVLELIPPNYTNLGLPPTLDSCTRDAFIPGASYSVNMCLRILMGIAAAGIHLHDRGIAHGDLYAHNILIDPSGSALLGDFGAATIYRPGHDKAELLERMEVFAFGHLIEDLLGLVKVRNVMEDEEAMAWKDPEVVEALNALHWRCMSPVVRERPGFGEVWRDLSKLGRV